MDLLLKRMLGLLCIKSLVTLILTLVFAYLAANSLVSTDEFLTVFTVVIAFYFGAESERQAKT